MLGQAEMEPTAEVALVAPPAVDFGGLPQIAGENCDP